LEWMAGSWSMSPSSSSSSEWLAGSCWMLARGSGGWLSSPLRSVAVDTGGTACR
jgi:hypothetical protein